MLTDTVWNVNRRLVKITKATLTDSKSDLRNKNPVKEMGVKF